MRLMIGNSPGFHLDASGTPLQEGQPKMSPTLPNVHCGQSHSLLRATALRDRVQLRECGGGSCSWGQPAVRPVAVSRFCWFPILQREVLFHCTTSQVLQQCGSPCTLPTQKTPKASLAPSFKDAAARNCLKDKYPGQVWWHHL